MLSRPIGSSLLPHPRKRMCVHRPRIKNWGSGGGTRGFGSLLSFPYPKAKILGWREDWVCPLGRGGRGR